MRRLLGEGSTGGIRAAGPFRLTCHQVSNTSQIHSFGPKRRVHLRRSRGGQPPPACLAVAPTRSEGWWAWVDSNYRPHAYQACALTRLSYRPVDPPGTGPSRAGSFKTRQDDSHARNTGPDVRRYHIGAVPRHSQESDRSEFQGTARAISQQNAKQDTELLESLERR